MGQGMRQWKALMRKNFINWKRQAKCSFFEICCPATVMLLMVVLRSIIDVEVFDFSSLNKVRQPVMPGLTYTTGTGWDTSKIGEQNTDLSPFFEYAEYPAFVQYDLGQTYSMQIDPLGPLFFLPSNCLKEKSF